MIERTDASEVDRSKQQESLAALIRVLYGLALVSGAKTAIDFYVAPASCFGPTYPWLASIALVVGLSDWLMYHFIVYQKNPYEGIPRLAADILFPIGIFFLFYLARKPTLFLSGLCLYFFGCVLYLQAIKKHLSVSQRKLVNLPPVAALMLTFIALFVQLFESDTRCQSLTTALALLGSFVWIVVNFAYVRRCIRRSSQHQAS